MSRLGAAPAEEYTSLLCNSQYRTPPLPELCDPDAATDDTLALVLWSSFSSTWAAKHNIFGMGWTLAINTTLMMGSLALVAAASSCSSLVDEQLTALGLNSSKQPLFVWFFTISATLLVVSLGTALLSGYTSRLRVLPSQPGSEPHCEKLQLARLIRGTLAWSRSLALFGDAAMLFMAAPCSWLVLSSIDSWGGQLLWVFGLSIVSLTYLELHDPDMTQHTSWRTQELWRAGHSMVIGVIAWLLTLGWTDTMLQLLRQMSSENNSWLLLCCFGYAGIHSLAALCAAFTSRSQRERLVDNLPTQPTETRSNQITAIDGANFSMGLQLLRKVLLFSAARALIDSVTVVMDHHDDLQVEGAEWIYNPLLTRFGVAMSFAVLASAAVVISDRSIRKVRLMMLDVRSLRNGALFQKKLQTLERCNDLVDTMALGFSFLLAASFHQFVTSLIEEWGHQDQVPDLWGYSFGVLLAAGMVLLLLFSKLMTFIRELPAEVHRPVTEPLKAGLGL